MERTLTRISLKSSEDASQTFYHIQNFIFFPSTVEGSKAEISATFPQQMNSNRWITQSYTFVCWLALLMYKSAERQSRQSFKFLVSFRVALMFKLFIELNLTKASLSFANTSYVAPVSKGAAGWWVVVHSKKKWALCPLDQGLFSSSSLIISCGFDIFSSCVVCAGTNSRSSECLAYLFCFRNLKNKKIRSLSQWDLAEFWLLIGENVRTQNGFLRILSLTITLNLSQHITNLYLLKFKINPRK